MLYEGRQIYFGPTTAAKQYFVDLGFWCPDRQTDADFLTSMTSPQERVVREGFEGRVPRTPDDFAAAWKASAHYKSVLAEIEAFNTEYPIGGPSLESFKASRKQQQSKHQRLGSPYTLSYAGQVKLCLDRGFQRLIADPSLTLFQVSLIRHHRHTTTSPLRHPPRAVSKGKYGDEFLDKSNLGRLANLCFRFLPTQSWRSLSHPSSIISSPTRGHSSLAAPFSSLLSCSMPSDRHSKS